MRSLTLVLLLILPFPLLASIKIEIQHSEAASYLHFLSSGFNEPFTSGSMKNLLLNSKVFNEANLAKEYDYFKTFLLHGYNYHDDVSNRPEGFWAEDAMTVLAVTSTNLHSFEKQLSAIMPYRAITSYFIKV